MNEKSYHSDAKGPNRSDKATKNIKNAEAAVNTCLKSTEYFLSLEILPVFTSGIKHHKIFESLRFHPDQILCMSGG